MKNIPDIEDMITNYSNKNLLAYPEEVRHFSKQIKKLQTEIPIDEINKNMAKLMIWPLIEIYKIRDKSIHQKLSKDEIQKILQLQTKFSLLKEHEDLDELQNFDKNEEFSVEFMNPYKISRDKYVNTITALPCEPIISHLKHTTQSRTKFIQDAQMGGTIFIKGKKNDFETKRISYEDHIGIIDFSFLQRSFISMTKDKEPILFMDMIESGNPEFKNLD